MFVKVTKSGPRQYVQLVEAFRDGQGRPKQRTVATLGRLDQIGDALGAVRDGLSRLLGAGPAPAQQGGAIFEPSRAFGDVWALDQLWKQLGLGRLGDAMGQRTRRRIDLEALLRVMVFNRLCDADSKLGALRWAQSVSLPDMGAQPVEHQHLLRAMDALAEHQEAIGHALADAVRPLVDEELSFIFYDITTIRVEGHTDLGQDLRRFGMSKEGAIARQFMLGLVQTAQGIPLYHEVFEGNAAEGKTLKDTLQKVMSLFPVKRAIAVADRGLLSIGNLGELQSMALPNGQPLEFILAVPGRRYGEFAQLLAPINEAAAASKDLETVQEFQWQGLRLVAAHDKLRAQEQGARRDAQIAEIEQQAALWAGKLGAQEAGGKGRGRKLSGGGALAKLYHAVREARLGHIVRADMKSGEFGYQIDGKALGLARAMDGKLLLASNAKGLGAKEIIDRYKSLGDIEQGFRVLKSEIEIGPVYHRLPERIRAHATICFIALILHRVIRARLQGCPVPGVASPERALASLRRIQTHCATLPGRKAPIRGISAISQEQSAIFQSLGIKKPTAKDAYLNL